METKQIVTSSFVALMEEVQKYILMGYRIQFGQHTSPYHQLMGNFIVNLEIESDGKNGDGESDEKSIDSDEKEEETAQTKQRGRKTSK